MGAAQAAVGRRDGGRAAFAFDTVYSGVVGFDQPRAGNRSAALATVSVAGLLRRAAAPRVVDYLSLDIEGAEAWAFADFPWAEYTLRSAPGRFSPSCRRPR